MHAEKIQVNADMKDVQIPLKQRQNMLKTRMCTFFKRSFTLGVLTTIAQGFKIQIIMSSAQCCGLSPSTVRRYSTVSTEQPCWQ